MKNNYTAFFFSFFLFYHFFSENYSISSGSEEIPVPVLISPNENIYSTEDSILLEWNSSGKKMAYEIMISANEDFSLGQRFATTDTIFKIEIKNLSRGIWFWRVRAFKNKNTYSGWSDPYYFARSQPPQIIRQGGCNGNCGACTHPCGRRRMNEYPIGE